MQLHREGITIFPYVDFCILISFYVIFCILERGGFEGWTDRWIIDSFYCILAKENRDLVRSRDVLKKSETL